MAENKERKRYYRKKTELFRLLEQMKLWPSRTGQLHGVKSIDYHGEYAIITTHCGQSFKIRDSRNSRAARWLRNKMVSEPCRKCKVPQWKLDKYSHTYFNGYGSDLRNVK